MDLTLEELKKYIIKENDIEYQPLFTYESFDKETKTYRNVTILKTAEQIKEEYMNIIAS